MGTTIWLPPELKARIERQADASGMSLEEFVRVTLERVVDRERSEDPLFSDTAVYQDDGPTDFASHHDGYLYGDVS